MIILITGATHTGKTLLARRLIKKFAFPCVSIDHIKMGLIRSGNTSLTPYDDAELTEYLWPIIREMIKTAIENSQDLIVEGCYVPFDWRSGFEERYLEQIRFICLAMTDDYIDAHFDDIMLYACDIEKRLYDDVTPEELRTDNRACAVGFTRAGERVTLIDGDYRTAIDEEIALLFSEL